MKRYLLVLATLLACFSPLPAVQAGGLDWVVSTDKACWVTRSKVQTRTTEKDPTSGDFLIVKPDALDQQIIGWGGCFNELGWKALLTLKPAARESVLKNLFDPTVGLRFNICRIPIGASDFALDGYSLDDVKDDYNLDHFSIDRDRQLLIPYIKAAMKYRPDLKVWASPWSPPGWMKDSGTYHGGKLRMEPKVLNAYAHYLARFVHDYRAEGIDLDAVHVQNEPVSDGVYPTCPWRNPEPMRAFIRNYLGPAFAEQKTQAQIWLGTMSENRLPWLQVILDDPAAAKYISGIGLQYNGRFVAKALHVKYPQFPLIETEAPCHSGNNDWKDGENAFVYFKQFIEGGTQAYMYWNMILDETGLSSWHWRQNSAVVIDTKTSEVTYTPEFYLMKHFSAFVHPGAHRLILSGNWTDSLGFKNSDGSIVLVIINKDKINKSLTLKIADQFATVILPAHSFSSFICN